jgi:energy-coupling factor transporter transmembrane protein EcfT
MPLSHRGHFLLIACITRRVMETTIICLVRVLMRIRRPRKRRRMTVAIGAMSYGGMRCNTGLL